MTRWREMVAGIRQPDGEAETPPQQVSELRLFRDAASRLRTMKLPAGANADRWGQVLADAEILVAKWGHLLEELGWTAEDVFGFDFKDTYGDHDGLVFAIRGGSVVLVDGRAAIIREPDGRTRRIHYRRPDPPQPIWAQGRAE